MNNHHHHHHIVVLVARISLTLSRHSSLSFIALGRSSGQHPVSSHSCWMYVRAGRPAFARPCVGIHKGTSLMSSSLLLQQCPACLVRLTWIVFVIGGRWPYSWCLELVILVEGNPKAPFSIATTQKCTGGHYSIPWISLLYPWFLPYNAKAASSTILWVFCMTRPEIEPRSSGPLANALLIGAFDTVTKLLHGCIRLYYIK